MNIAFLCTFFLLLSRMDHYTWSYHFFSLSYFGAFVLIIICECKIFSCTVSTLRNCDNPIFKQQIEVSLSSFEWEGKLLEWWLNRHCECINISSPSIRNNLGSFVSMLRHIRVLKSWKESDVLKESEGVLGNLIIYQPK